MLRNIYIEKLHIQYYELTTKLYAFCNYYYKSQKHNATHLSLYYLQINKTRFSIADFSSILLVFKAISVFNISFKHFFI